MNKEVLKKATDNMRECADILEEMRETEEEERLEELSVKLLVKMLINQQLLDDLQNV